jgi:hypothetical protein
VVNVADFGAVGDGVTDDAPAINNASAFAVANGIGKIIFVAGKTYRVANKILPRRDLIWDGQGCTITATTFIAGGLFHNPTETGLANTYGTGTHVFIGDLTTDFVGPSNQIGPLTSVAQLSVGDWVGVGIGLNPYQQTPSDFRYATPCRVLAINTGTKTITVDWVFPYSIPIGPYTYAPRDIGSTTPTSVIAAPAGAGNPPNFLGGRCVYRIDDVAANLTFRDFNLQGNVTGGQIQGGFQLQWAVNVVFERITGNPNTNNMTAEIGSLISIQYGRNIRIYNSVLHCNQNASSPLQSALGNMYGFSNCIDVIDTDHYSKNLWGHIAFCEDMCENIQFIRPYDVVDKATVAQSPSASAQIVAYAFFGSLNTFRIDSPTLITNLPAPYTPGVAPNFQNYILSNDASIQVTGVFTWRGPLAAMVIAWPRWLNCVFDFNDGTGDKWGQLDFAHSVRYSFKIPLYPNMSAVRYLVPGGIIDCEAYLSGNANAATVTELMIGFEGADAHASLFPGNVVIVANKFAALAGDPSSGWSFGNVNDWLLGYNLGVEVSTTSAAQPPGAFVGVSVRMPEVLLTSDVSYGNVGWGQGYGSINDDQMSGELSGEPVQEVWNTMLVSALPAAAASNVGFRYIVSDATVTTFGTVVAGGGANVVPVYSTGTNWRIG